MASPFDWSLISPKKADPLHFRYFFNDLARRHLPCEHAELYPAAAVDLGPEEFSEESREAMRLAGTSGRPVIDSRFDRLFLPLAEEGGLYGIAVLEGGDPALYRKYTTKKLLELGEAVTADFKALQARALDPLTGLFNSVLWGEHLENCLGRRDDFVLILLEIYPRARDAAHAHAYLQRAAGTLDSIVGRGIPLFHFGSGLFGMLWHDLDLGEVRTLADVILYRLQRDGLDRARMGQVRVEGGSNPGFGKLMDQAWKAVVMARQRGPFAKAVYPGEEERNRHPFRPLSAPEMNRFRDLWRDEETFCVAALKSDRDGRDLGKLLGAHLGAGEHLVGREGGEPFLFFGWGDQVRTATALAKLRDKVAGESGGGFSAGLAAFPCAGFKRSAVPVNARKALQHTLFFRTGHGYRVRCGVP
ncbi:MAG: hypothetical protein ABR605_05495 [Desulfurivibrionaceae bacterium]